MQYTEGGGAIGIAKYVLSGNVGRAILKTTIRLKEKGVCYG